MSLEVGDVIQDKYKIVRLLGHGGMGAVYEGINTLIARRVAIKVLFGGVASQAGVVERFEREAQAAGRIGNDHILEVLDLGTLADGNRFMVMEYLDGETLGDRTKRVGPMTARELYPIARQLLQGLSAAHDAGIIHRDLKPDNVFIVREKAGRLDYVKIIDFGISKFTALDQDMKMTATGAVMGTPYFMSPEQAQGIGTTDARSDLYAVGVILYKAATGQVPFDGATFNELLFKIVLSPMPMPRALVPEFDPAFETIIQKAMARAPDRRFQSAMEFIQALDVWHSTGAAVTVPPPEETGLGVTGMTAGPAVPVAGGTQIAVTADGGTKGTWAQSDVVSPQKKSPAGLWIAGAAAVVVIGGAIAGLTLGSNSAESTGDTQESTVAAVAVPSAPPADVPVAPPQVAPIPDPEPATSAPPAASDVPPPEGSATAQAAAPSPEPPPPTKPTAAVPAPKPVKVSRPAPVKPAAPKPAAPKPPVAAPKPAPAPKSGSPDFGY